jgi:hypothetical protein
MNMSSVADLGLDPRPVGRPREFDKKLNVSFTKEQWDFISGYSKGHGLSWGDAIREILDVGRAAIETGGRRVELPRRAGQGGR